MVPLADVSGYFLNPQILLCGFKNFHVHTCPYSNRICRPHVSGFTLSSSANLIAKRSSAQAKILSPACFTDKIVPWNTIFRLFNLFTAFNPSVLHGKKLQNVKPPFGIIEVYSNHSYNEGQTCWDTFIKWPTFKQFTYLSPSPMHSNPLPPKPMLCFRPSSLSFTTNNIDLGVGELRCLNRTK